MEVYILAEKNRLLNGVWKLEMKNYINNYVKKTKFIEFHKEIRVVQFLLSRIMKKKDVSLFQDLQLLILLMHTYFFCCLNDFKGEWSMNLWSSINRVVDAHYIILKYKFGVDFVSNSCYKFKGIRQDLINFEKKWEDHNFGIDTYGITQEDGFQGLISLCKLAINVYHVKH